MRHQPIYYIERDRNIASMQRFNRVKALVVDWFLTFVVVACILAIGAELAS